MLFFVVGCVFCSDVFGLFSFGYAPPFFLFVLFSYPFFLFFGRVGDV